MTPRTSFEKKIRAASDLHAGSWVRVETLPSEEPLSSLQSEFGDEILRCWLDRENVEVIVACDDLGFRSNGFIRWQLEEFRNVCLPMIMDDQEGIWLLSALKTAEKIFHCYREMGKDHTEGR